MALADDLLADQQAFTVSVPERSVGLVGDACRHGSVVVLHSVETIDCLTARCTHIPQDFPDLVSHRIINEPDGISHVTQDVFWQAVGCK